MPSIPELEERLAGAAGDAERMDAGLDLALAMTGGDPRGALAAAEAIGAEARAALDRIAPRGSRRGAGLAQADAVEMELRIARALHVAGRCRKLLAEFPAALAAYDEAGAILTRLGDRQRCSDVLTDRGSAQFAADDIAGSIETLERALALKEELGDRRGMAATLGNLGIAHRTIGDVARSLGSMQRCLRVFTELGDDNGIATSHFNIGYIYHISGNVTPALEEFSRSLTLFEAAGEAGGTAHALNNLGSIYQQMGDLDRAESFFERSLAIKERLGDQRGMATTLDNLSSIERSRGNHEAAREHCRRALAIADALEAPGVRAGALLEMSEIARTCEDLDTAITHAEAAAACWRNVRDEHGTARALLVLGNALAAAGRSNEAIDALERALRIARGLNGRPLEADIDEALSGVHRTAGHYRRALEHHERFHATRELIFNDESDRRVRTLMATLDLERAEREASVLRLTNAQLEQEAGHRKRELATTAMYLTEKNEFLHRLRRRLTDLHRDGSGPGLAGAIDDILRDIDAATDSVRSWEAFEQRFQQVHGDFPAVLAARFPALTPTERKVCTLIRTDLSSKEIARVLATEERTIERYRQRIRKKLGLGTQENLGTVLAALGNA